MSMFAGTAEYYDKYRPGIPEDLVTRLVGEAGRDAPPHSLLDLGAGTGKVVEQFLPYFKDIIAVEPDEALMARAKKRLIREMRPETSIFFLDGSAEIVQYPPNWQATLVTMCRSFHWMDQTQVLARLQEVVEPGGVIAIFSDQSFWTLNNIWAVEVRQVVQSFLGEVRKAGERDVFPETEASFDDLLQASAFSNTETFTVPVRRAWNAEGILGYLYSTSFASKQLFGDRAAEFEQTLKNTLQGLMPTDIFVEQNEFTVLLGRRP